MLITRPGPDTRHLGSKEDSGGNAARPPTGLDNRSQDGGTRAWLAVFGCWLALFASLGFMNVLATFRAYLTTTGTVHLSPGTIGGVIFGYASLSFLVGIYVGPLFDKYGPKWLILGGTVSLVASLLLASVGTATVLTLVALAILGSFGSTLLYLPSIAVIAHVFSTRRGLATGLATTSTSASGVVFPFLLRALFASVGWTWAVRIISLFCLVLTGAANFLITRAPTLSKKTEEEEEKEEKRNKKNTPGFTPTLLATFCAQLASFLALSYMSRYALFREKFGRAAGASEVVAIANGASAAGRVLVGWAADRTGPFNASVGCCAAAALAALAVWLPAAETVTTWGAAVAFAALFGLASGGAASLVPVAVGRLCDTRQFGRCYGTCHAISSFLVVLATPVAEQVAGRGGNRGNYLGLAVATGVLYAAAAAAFAAARVTVVGRRICIAF
ncbi:major facilitator superfamily domain-containing protein [Corynascus novoguineensis]|uniref:Major facilitator superfamily domain-containing protein n=1 Tax=Corynascus novoguineensis TaxID=1126955 RepID=A0AAN7CV32_9PEZI|nr:major facilitator superfamily domain-containing protein [Corynascus novoguineensis]